MGCIRMLCKIVLVIVNLLLLLIGLAMLAVGIIIVAVKDVYKDTLEEIEQELADSASSLGTTLDTENFSLAEFIVPLGYALIALGILIGTLSLIGCIGSCYSIKCVLIIYVIISGVLFLVQLVFTILVFKYRSSLDDLVKPYMKDSLDSYAGIEGTDTNTLAWNAIMNFEKCCGIDNYTDFHGLDNWPAPINGVLLPLVTPVICCKSKSTSYICATTPTDATNYMNTGCYDELFNLFTDNAGVLSAVIITLVLQFLLIFLALVIICTDDNKIGII